MKSAGQNPMCFFVYKILNRFRLVI